MTATAELPIKAANSQTPKRITWAAFKRRYLSRDDEYTYEWVNGQVEKTKRAMDYRNCSCLSWKKYDRLYGR